MRWRSLLPHTKSATTFEEIYQFRASKLPRLMWKKSSAERVRNLGVGIAIGDNSLAAKTAKPCENDQQDSRERQIENGLTLKASACMDTAGRGAWHLQGSR